MAKKEQVSDLPPDGFINDGPPDGYIEDNTASVPQSSPIMGAVSQALPNIERSTAPLQPTSSNPMVAGAQAAMQTVMNPGRAYSTMSKGAEELGNITAEKLGQAGVNPILGAVAGFGASIAADPGTFVGAGASKLAPAVRRLPTELEKTAQRFGLDLTKGEILNSKPLLLLERALENTPGGSKVIQQMREKRVQQLTKLRDTLVAREASPQALEKVGLDIQDAAKQVMSGQEAVQKAEVQRMIEGGAQRLGASTEDAGLAGANALDAIRKASSSAKDDVSKAFGEVESLIPQDLAVEPNMTRKAAGELQASLKLTKESLRDSGTEAVVNDFLQPQQMTWAQLKANRESLTQLINQADASAAYGVKGAGSKNVAYLQKLKSAISQDMELLAKQAGPDVSETYAVANAMHGRFKDTFNNDVVRSLIKMADEKPDRLISQVFAPGRTTEIRNVKAMIGENKFKPLKDRFTTTLFGLDRDASLNPASLRQNIASYKREMLTEVYGKDGYNDLVNLATTIEKTGAAPVGNPFVRSLLQRQPEKVMNFVIRPNNVGSVQQAKLLMGQERWKEAAASWLDQEVLAKNPDALVRPADFVKMLDNYGADTVKAAVGDRQFNTLKRIGAVSRLIQRAEDISANRSGTSGVSGMMGLITHPISALLKFAGSRAVAKWYLDPKASELLLSGFSAMPKSRQAVSAVRQLAAMGGIQLNQEALDQLPLQP
jgi:hypothetical protein